MSLKYIDENGNEVSIAGVGKDAESFNDRLFTKLIPDGTEIQANSNLNSTDFLKVGRYFCPTNTTVATLSNAPDGNAFVMNVYSPISDTIDNENTGTPYVYRIQNILTYNGLRYTRSCETGSAGTWTYGTWKKISYSTDAFATVQSATLSVSKSNWTDGVMTNSATYTKSGYFPIFGGYNSWSATGAVILQGVNVTSQNTGTITIQITVKGNNVTSSTKGGSVQVHIAWIKV